MFGFDRRDFLKLAGLAIGANVAQACAPILSREATLVPATETKTPETPASATLTSEPSPTPVQEIDLKPNYTETISHEFVGVMINAQLITDKSLDPVITEVFVPEATYAEFIARTIFKTWWKKGNEPHQGLQTEADFRAFMENWARAQETNEPADWAKVQLNDIWANDLNDGNGYQQQPYTVWPMAEGETPEGVRGITNLGIALVRTSRMDNITVFDNNAYDQSFGTNLDDKGNLFIYIGMINNLRYSRSVASAISNSAWWLPRNLGQPVSGGTPDSEKSLANSLLNGGMTITPHFPY